MPHSSTFLDSKVFNATVLREQPNDFIVGCQPLIDMCVRYYIKKKLFSLDDKQDIIQSVNESLIMQLPKISEQYNGMSSLESYMSVIIYNMCLKIHRDDPAPPPPVGISEGRSGVHDEPATGLIIRQELEIFRTILILLYRNRNKFILFAKYYFCLPVTENDIRRVFPSIHFHDISRLISLSESHHDKEPIEDIFKAIAPFIAKYEGTKVDPDSLRRWTIRTINQVVRQLNGDPPESAHTSETLKELIDEYCHSEYYA